MFRKLNKGSCDRWPAPSQKKCQPDPFSCCDNKRETAIWHIPVCCCSHLLAHPATTETKLPCPVWNHIPSKKFQLYTTKVTIMGRWMPRNGWPRRQGNLFQWRPPLCIVRLREQTRTCRIPNTWFQLYNTKVAIMGLRMPRRRWPRRQGNLFQWRPPLCVVLFKRTNETVPYNNPMAGLIPRRPPCSPNI